MQPISLLIAGLLCAAGLTAMPASTTAVTPAKLSIEVFFDANSSDLNEVARSTLRREIPAIRWDRGCRNIRVAGHLDGAEAKAGKAGALDRQRAANVRDVLQKFGFLDRVIDTFAYGSDLPLVYRRDAMQRLIVSDHEPQNRRAEVHWSCRIP
ncbi:MAG: hypothetical protein FJX20_18010 [Alphaproteobacteria bacterium]|nr:hypothetical protein [Alphaproteobacteria bacterium]